MIPTPHGIVPISSLVNINRDTGPTEINRKDEKRIIEISADSFGRPVNDIVSDIKKEINNIYIFQLVFQLIFLETTKICKRLFISF